MPEAHQRVVDALGNEFTAESLAALEQSAIPPGKLDEYGIRAVRHPDHVPEDISRYWIIGEGRGPGMLFPWRDMDRTVWQFRPDEPVLDNRGKAHKYVLPNDCGTFLTHWREGEEGQPVLFVEGTKQAVSAAVWAPEEWGVVGVPGCQNWVGTDLSWAEDKKVVVVFDGDVAVNRDVYDAATGLKDALDAEGALEVVFARLAGARAKEGLDDVLGRRAPDRRQPYIVRIAGAASGRLGRRPVRREVAGYFNDKGGLLAKTTAEAVLEGQPAALGHGSMIALYRDGAFRIERNKEPLISRIKTMLGEDYRPSWRATVEEYLLGELYERGMRIPEHATEPVVNLLNGMLDLRTGELLEHDPKYLSALQLPVAWDPEAVCPVYEAWLDDVIPEQKDHLEEVASTMLDPSRTPAKAIFLFGPSKSGKSTFLRIMRTIAGAANTSAVTLHQLADDKFMAAQLYGRILNVAADLSAAHVQDTSMFKMLSGEDPVEANQKYGKTFTFMNQALFAFSANEIPTVSETSRAYVNRIAAFGFSRSFAGREKPEIEEHMLRRELPGILRRWVAAWQRFRERGSYMATDPAVQREFENRSDRVARWVDEKCCVNPEMTGKLVGAECGDSVQSLYVAFKQWTKDDGSADAMSRPKFSERLRSMEGVGEVRLRHRNKNLGLNVTLHSGEKPTPVQNQTKVGNHDTQSVGGCESVWVESVASDQRSVGSVGNPPIKDYRFGRVEHDQKGLSQNPLGYVGENSHSPHRPTPRTSARCGSRDIAAAAEFLGTADASPRTPASSSVTSSDSVTDGDAPFDWN